MTGQEELSERLPGCPPILAGPGAIRRLRDGIDVATPVCLVTDPGLARSPIVARVQDALGGVDANTHTLVTAPGEPHLDDVERIAAAVRAHADATIVGLGGGTALDVAKMVAGLAAGDGALESFLVGRRNFEDRRPLVLVPTTSGTGAEITRTAVVAHGGRKVWTWGDALLPDRIILDPEFTVGLPPDVTAWTGIDAVVHAIEAATGRRRNTVPPSVAAEAISRMADALPTLRDDPEDLEARASAQLGACLAGAAIDRGGTGLAHALGHALGSITKIPHGVAVGLSMLATMEWSLGTADDDGFGIVAEALGCRPSEIPATLGRLADTSGFRTDTAGRLPRDLDVAELAKRTLASENQPMCENHCRTTPPASIEPHAAAVWSTWKRWAETI